MVEPKTLVVVTATVATFCFFAYLLARRQPWVTTFVRDESGRIIEIDEMPVGGR